jgi:hypothetical protein
MWRVRRRGSPFPAVFAACALLPASQTFAEQTFEISVSTATELIEALKPEQRARKVRLRAGRYTLEAPLSVPDGVELAGEGVMRVDADGLPAGSVPGTETILVASERLQGDLVTLGDGTLLHGLRIEGPARDAGHRDATAGGHVVVIASRRPGDRLQATLRECEIVNHGDFRVGRAVVVMTRNPGAGVAWHQGARVSTRIERSIVRNNADSNSVFAINFAGGGTVALDLERNRFEGTLSLAGGGGLPDRVEGATATLLSRNNLYVSSGGTYPAGWQIIGGSVSPHLLTTEGAESNSVRVESRDDRVEGYRIGILASAGRLVSGMPGVVKRNRGELLLSRLTIRTVGDGATDLSLHGALTDDNRGVPAEPATRPAATTRAEDNVLRVSIQGSTGSGHRKNVYAHVSPDDFAATATGQHSNRLDFTGSRAQFLDSNAAFDPAPDARHFLPQGDR